MREGFSYPMSNLFRYPGSKFKFRDKIVGILSELLRTTPNLEYREPFFGSGSVGVELLRVNNGMFSDLNKIWINDLDIGISSLWTSLLKHPEKLKEKVVSYTPMVEDFYKYRSKLLNMNFSDSIVDIGFMKLVVHQISYSGLGTMSGSPLGGKEQESEYKIDCRWSPNHIVGTIDKIIDLFREYEVSFDMCTSVDYTNLIVGAHMKEPHNVLLYLDPPYFVNGSDLYQHSFSRNDHNELAYLLQNTECRWLLSYDDCPEIRELYKWAKIETLDVNYSIKGSRYKQELLIQKN